MMSEVASDTKSAHPMLDMVVFSSVVMKFMASRDLA